MDGDDHHDFHVRCLRRKQPLRWRKTCFTRGYLGLILLDPSEAWPWSNQGISQKLPCPQVWFAVVSNNCQCLWFAMTAKSWIPQVFVSSTKVHIANYFYRDDTWKIVWTLDRWSMYWASICPSVLSCVLSVDICTERLASSEFGFEIQWSEMRSWDPDPSVLASSDILAAALRMWLPNCRSFQVSWPAMNAGWHPSWLN